MLHLVCIPATKSGLTGVVVRQGCIKFMFSSFIVFMCDWQWLCKRTSRYNSRACHLPARIQEGSTSDCCKLVLFCLVIALFAENSFSIISSDASCSALQVLEQLYLKIPVSKTFFLTNWSAVQWNQQPKNNRQWKFGHLNRVVGLTTEGFWELSGNLWVKEFHFGSKVVAFYRPFSKMTATVWMN